MKQLVVRNLEDDIHAAIRQRALRHGRSVEAEVREILARAAAHETSVRNSRGSGPGHRIAARFAGIGLRDTEEIPEHRGNEARAADLS